MGVNICHKALSGAVVRLPAWLCRPAPLMPPADPTSATRRVLLRHLRPPLPPPDVTDAAPQGTRGSDHVSTVRHRLQQGGSPAPPPGERAPSRAAPDPPTGAQRAGAAGAAHLDAEPRRRSSRGDRQLTRVRCALVCEVSDGERSEVSGQDFLWREVAVCCPCRRDTVLGLRE